MTLEERELKFSLPELDSLRQRLVEIGAVPRLASSRERNWVLDRESELLGSARLLRLREGGGGVRLTFKGPPRYEGGMKIRREIEAGVEGVEEMLGILTGVGYQVVRRYEKFREEWQIDDTVICLDRTPIGSFAEFEGGDAVAVARSTGLDPSTADPRSYLAIYQDYRGQHPEAPPDMLFDDASPDEPSE